MSLLLQITQNIRIQTSTTASIPISAGDTDRMSPIKYLLYLVKLLPPSVATKMPNATAVHENTPISVSAVWLLLWRTAEKSREKTIAKITANKVGSPNPQIHPIAIPVKAEWPSASEKKLMFPVTIMVDISPNKGAIISTASKAFCMNCQWNISNGNQLQKLYQILILHLRFCERHEGTPDWTKLPRQCRGKESRDQSKPLGLHI